MCADQFARYMDFLSIGTNDLIQYTLAIDRVDDESEGIGNCRRIGIVRFCPVGRLISHHQFSR